MVFRAIQLYDFNNVTLSSDLCWPCKLLLFGYDIMWIPSLFPVQNYIEIFNVGKKGNYCKINCTPMYLIRIKMNIKWQNIKTFR